MRVLIVGFGSIGKRHFNNFKEIGADVAVLSRRKLDEVFAYQSPQEAVEKFNPEFVVIANETYLHEESLSFFSNIKSITRILVEKPLYSNIPSAITLSEPNKIKVAYHLRFHPLISELKAKLKDERIILWNSYVGQNLKLWRPGRDYRNVYSSSKEQGGGALRDLSHEIDLFQYINGSPSLIHSHGGHFSELETNADDAFSLLMTAGSCRHGNIHMNCIDRISQRHITVQTMTNTFVINFITGEFRDSSSQRTLEFDRNEPYLRMSREFLQGSQELCSFEQGLMVNKLIAEAEREL